MASGAARGRHDLAERGSDCRVDTTEERSPRRAASTRSGSRGSSIDAVMGNVYYCYPKWRVSPYAGFGLGAFFHDGAFTSTVTVENELGTIGLPNIELPNIGFPTEPLRTTAAYEDSRFAYQIMGGLSTRVSPRVEFHFGYRFRSSRGAPIDADQIEAGIRFRF